MQFVIPDADAMEALGARFAGACEDGGVFYLRGELGTGKTTFVRGFIHAMGYTGFVKSPTFTLVESYGSGDRRFHHFDLFRLAAPEELEFLGVRDYFTAQAVCFVEWPDRGAGVLPGGDIDLAFDYAATGRRVVAEAGTARGRRIIAALEELPDKSGI